jgi:hypothetical protein
MVFLGSCNEYCQYNTDWVSSKISSWDSLKEYFSDINNTHCLEIGSFEGRSANYWAENYCNGKNSAVDCLDTWTSVNREYKENLFERFKSNVNTHINSGRLNFYQDISIKTLTNFLYEVHNNQREKYNFIYIDGSHVADNVLQDAVLADQMLKVGGIMGFDDYRYYNNDLPPIIAINGFLEANKGKYETLINNTQLFLYKKKESADVKWGRTL